MPEVNEMEMLANNEMKPDQMAEEQFRMVNTFREFTDGEDDEEASNQTKLAGDTGVELTTDFFTNEPQGMHNNNSIELIDDDRDYDDKIVNY